MVRFFLGESLDLDLCSQPEAISRAYKTGVPMGGTSQADLLNRARLFISASADSSLKDQYIEKLQVVKGTIVDGEVITTVQDIMTHETADIDLNSCEVIGNGVRSMCAVWDDPNFIQGDEAYYYVRVIANKSCRWSHYLCLKNSQYCEDSNLNIPKFIQERAWTSPIWLENSTDI